MQDSKNTARETQLLAVADVAGMIGVKETTVYRWCSEEKLPCLKIGKHWRIRRGVLQDFLKQPDERPGTLVGLLDSFLAGARQRAGHRPEHRHPAPPGRRLLPG